MMPFFNRNTGLTILPAIMLLTPQDCSRSPETSAATDESYQAIAICEAGLQATLRFVEDNGDQWGLSGDGSLILVNRDQRLDLVRTWSSLLDYMAQLDYIKVRNRGFPLDAGDQPMDEDFSRYFLAFLTQYRYALEFLDLVEKNRSLDAILNEAHPNLGLQENTYRGFKFHFLNVAIATEFVALNLLDRDSDTDRSAEVEQKIDVATKYIYGMGTGRGIQLTLANGIKIIRQKVFSLWFPVQKTVAGVLAGKKFRRRGKYLITNENIGEMTIRMQPGDIVFQRREWTLTNVGIPGFWTHSALYIGDPESRRKLFLDEKSVAWVQSQGEASGDFERLLKNNFPVKYGSLLSESADNYQLQIIEALKPGVILSSIEKSFSADGVAVLRPRLEGWEKAEAIFRAFHYLGRPYDFNFDFLTDSSLVCSEVIYKAYEPTDSYGGVSFETASLSGRFMVSPNQMVVQFDRQYGTDEQQLDFVLFYDGIEKLGEAIPASLEQFRSSWKRLDWHILFQDVALVQ